MRENHAQRGTITCLMSDNYSVVELGLKSVSLILKPILFLLQKVASQHFSYISFYASFFWYLFISLSLILYYSFLKHRNHVSYYTHFSRCSQVPSSVLCVHARQCPTFCSPMDYNPPGSSVHWNFPGKNTGMGYYALLQGIFLTHAS